MLSPYRVIDLADHRGIFCAKVLGDLGADIIKVEPPGGDPARGIGPFLDDRPEPEHSLFWLAHATNRRSVTLDIEREDGRVLLKRLIETAHFLVESFTPGYLDGLGLGYGALRELNSALVYVSITPFGQTGPRAQAPATDLTGVALGGSMYMTGEPGLAPVRVSQSPQFWLVGGAAAAAGAMVAHHHRMLTGEGQHVDVSSQQAIARTLSHAPSSWDLNGVNTQRGGAYRQVGSVTMRIIYPCADGYVAFFYPGGAAGARSMRGLVRWRVEEGEPDAFIEQTDWGAFEFGTMPQAVLDQLDSSLSGFFATRTKRALAEAAIEHRVILFPVSDARDLLEYPQLAAREFWQEVEYPELGRMLRHPGPFIRATNANGRAASANVGIRRRAPRIGEHNREVLGGELGLSDADLAAFRREGAV